MMRVLITGITGQDGSYLAEQLIEEGCEVHGLIRRSSSFNTSRISHLYQDPHERDRRLHLHYGDMLDGHSLRKVLEASQPDEVYNLAAQSHVAVSFEQPAYTHEVVAVGNVRLLEAMHDVLGVGARFYQASTSEMFGNSPGPHSEKSAFNPQSPYGVAKVAAFYNTLMWRERGMFAVNGILSNHCSPRRGETFVDRKITRAVGRISWGLQDKLYLGNLEARRDWGWAPDYTRAMVQMLRHSEPDDFVVATGVSHSVGEFVANAFGRVGLSHESYVEVDERYFRKAEVHHLCGDPSKFHRTFGDGNWRSLGFNSIVAEMVRHDLWLARKEAKDT